MLYPSWSVRLIVVAALIAIMAGCGKQPVFQDSRAIPAEGWRADQLIHFEMSLSDTVPLHELYLLVRNTTDYPYSNLYLFLDIVFPDNRLIRDTLECMLVQRDGQWTGKGFGKIRTNQFLFRDDVWFPATGTYHFRIQHGMRDDVLLGISDIGIRLDKK